MRDRKGKQPTNHSEATDERLAFLEGLSREALMEEAVGVMNAHGLPVAQVMPGPESVRADEWLQDNGWAGDGDAGGDGET